MRDIDSAYITLTIVRVVYNLDDFSRYIEMRRAFVYSTSIVVAFAFIFKPTITVF